MKNIQYPIILIFMMINTYASEPLFYLQGQQLVARHIVDASLDLVDISTINPSIKIDIRYATSNNLTGQPLYSSGVCYVRHEVARALDALQKELQSMGLGLKIWDAFRPINVQAACYKQFPQFFAQPTAARAKHPRGTAVDVTLVDESGQELLMPTAFDALVEQARHEYRGADIPAQAIENREALKSLMAKYGFCALAHEWWHYDFWNWKSYDIIPYDFDEIERLLNS